MCEGEATRRGRHTATAWLINGDLGEQGNITQHSDSDKRNGSVTMEYCGGRGEIPTHDVSKRRRERGKVQRRMWRGPCTLCYRDGDCETACERSEFGAITLSGGE
uniref:Uncharacterized protein n=1 Tax=Setaria viridis TaxID=4556 RepID=A0A4U6WGS0_SETVI|nr:hypothetical protein SEVIR_1G029700v2 [Setaria viridis]